MVAEISRILRLASHIYPARSAPSVDREPAAIHYQFQESSKFERTGLALAATLAIPSLGGSIGPCPSLLIEFENIINPCARHFDVPSTTATVGDFCQIVVINRHHTIIACSTSSTGQTRGTLHTSVSCAYGPARRIPCRSPNRHRLNFSSMMLSAHTKSLKSRTSS